MHRPSAKPSAPMDAASMIAEALKRKFANTKHRETVDDDEWDVKENLTPPRKVPLAPAVRSGTIGSSYVMKACLFLL